MSSGHSSELGTWRDDSVLPAAPSCRIGAILIDMLVAKFFRGTGSERFEASSEGPPEDDVRQLRIASKDRAVHVGADDVVCDDPFGSILVTIADTDLDMAQGIHFRSDGASTGVGLESADSGKIQQPAGCGGDRTLSKMVAMDTEVDQSEAAFRVAVYRFEGVAKDLKAGIHREQNGSRVDTIEESVVIS
jgi:hypothetical protein